MSHSHNTTIHPEQIFFASNQCTALYNDTKKSNLLFELDTAIQIPQNVDCFIQINNFKFTNAFYNVNSTCNMFYFDLSSVEIPIGNYSISKLTTTLNTALLNAGTNIMLVYDALTFKITIVSIVPRTIILGPNNIFSILGYVTEREANTLHTSENLINLSGVELLYITIPNVQIKSNGVRGGLKNVLESVHINVPIGSSQTYSNSHSTKYKVLENVITSFIIQIYDEEIELVDMNNVDWFISMSVIFSYKNQYIVDENLLTKQN